MRDRRGGAKRLVPWGRRHGAKGAGENDDHRFTAVDATVVHAVLGDRVQLAAVRRGRVFGATGRPTCRRTSPKAGRPGDCNRGRAEVLLLVLR